MAPDWEKLSEEWKDHKVGLVAEVDCTDEDSLALCEKYEVEGFPTLLYGDPFSPEVRKDNSHLVVVCVLLNVIVIGMLA